MILLDANILLYSYIDSLPQHRRVAKWLQDLLSTGTETIGVSWIAATGFMRISTNRRIFKIPSSPGESADRLDELFEHPMVRTIGPTDRHWPIYSDLIRKMNLAGDVLMDAHIAATAIENNAAVATADKDFRRFSDYVRIIDPLAK